MKNESALLQPLKEDLFGSYFTILVCGQRILLTVNMFVAIQLGVVRYNNNPNIIYVIRSSCCNPPPHFYFFHDTRIDNLCNSMLKHS